MILCQLLVIISYNYASKATILIQVCIIQFLHFYKSFLLAVFHRSIKNFMVSQIRIKGCTLFITQIQGGDPSGTGKGIYNLLLPMVI